MDEADLLHAAEAFVREQLAGDASGHDWWHIARVRALACTIAREEGADQLVCELAALVHDIADEKIAGDESSGLALVRGWLEAHSVAQATTSHVMEIIATMSFKGGQQPPVATLEGRVVQDADRLDALGAVGIARAFAYGGTKGRALYDPDIAPHGTVSAAEYRASMAPTINHFYEKLLLLRDRMNTPYARQLATARHRYMEQFLTEFYAEWHGER